MENCDFLDNFDKKTKVLCASISSVVILITVLVGISFGAVEPTEYGILYNTISKQIDIDTILEGGL